MLLLSSGLLVVVFFWLIILCCMALLNPCVFRVSYNSSLMLQISPNNLIFMALNSSKTQCCTALSSFPDDNWSMKLLVRQSFKNLSNLTSNTCSDWQMLSYIGVFTPKEANEHRVTPLRHTCHLDLRSPLQQCPHPVPHDALVEASISPLQSWDDVPVRQKAQLETTASCFTLCPKCLLHFFLTSSAISGLWLQYCLFYPDF